MQDTNDYALQHKMSARNGQNQVKFLRNKQKEQEAQSHHEFFRQGGKRMIDSINKKSCEIHPFSELEVVAGDLDRRILTKKRRKTSDSTFSVRVM